MPAATPDEAPPPLVGRARAHANIALVKYWGKADERENLPAVPSLSLTLDRLKTETEVSFDPRLERDVAWIDGVEQSGRPLERIQRLLDQVRGQSRLVHHAEVRSKNSFPTASGLASSASGFAALSLGAARAAGLDSRPEAMSELARRASASASRSIFGGYVVLGAGAKRAEQLLAPDAWPLTMVVAMTTVRPKPIGSTEAMLTTARTSPYYAAWIESSTGLFEEARSAVLERDLDRLGEAMEASTLSMHASMLAARPSILFFTAATLAAIDTVRALRASGTQAYFTVDAGPHVKVLTTPEATPAVETRLRATPGVEAVVVCHPGPGAELLAAAAP